MFPLPARILADALAPSIARWSEAREKTILANGRALAPSTQEFAKRLGISDPIRLEIIGTVPLPLPAAWCTAVRKLGMPVFHPAGMALGQGISAISDDPALLRHELVHVLQYQRLGGHLAFMRQYLFEVLHHGYAAAPLELEARDRSASTAAGDHTDA